MIRHDALPKSQAARDRYDPTTRASQPKRAARRTKYRHDQAAHEDARAKVDAERRREIAAAGGRARAAMYGHTGEASPLSPIGTRANQAEYTNLAERLAALQTQSPQIRLRTPHPEAFAPHPPANVQRTAAKTPALPPSSGPARARSAPPPARPEPKPRKSSVAAKPQQKPMPDVWTWPPGERPKRQPAKRTRTPRGHFAPTGLTPAQIKAAAAARAAASRPARRAAQRARAAAARRKP
jgi:hypothetical protein